MVNPIGHEQASHYRAMGWWPGERLEERYRQVSASRAGELAVTDSHGRELTHTELWQRSDELAGELAAQGVSKGDVILLILPNRVEWQIALLAILRLQAVPASIPTATDAQSLAYMASLVHCSLLVTVDDCQGQDLVDMAVSAAKHCSHAFGIIAIAANGQHRWEKKLTDASRRQSPPDGIDHVMFTSSTTGLPKAVMHTADTLAALNVTFVERFSLGPDQAIFMASPLGHSVGSIHGARLALFTGALLVLQESWDPQAALAIIEQYACAFTAAATPFLKDLLDTPATGCSPKLASLRTFLCGGAPVPPALLEQASQMFADTFVSNLWGMTEGGLVTCVPDSPREKIVATAGIGLPGLELRVLDANGKVLQADEEGELAMRGPGVFTGYLGQDDLYQSLLTADGFFRTGDLARIDDEGYVRITGRLKDLIIRGGVNISPLPTEDILSTHPQVHSVAVVGFPDERMGERICVVLQPEGGRPTLDELITFALDRGLPKRHLPEVIRYIGEMPRTAAGKIRKPVLHKMIAATGPDQLDLDVM